MPRKGARRGLPPKNATVRSTRRSLNASGRANLTRTDSSAEGGGEAHEEVLGVRRPAARSPADEDRWADARPRSGRRQIVQADRAAARRPSRDAAVARENCLKVAPNALGCAADTSHRCDAESQATASRKKSHRRIRDRRPSAAVQRSHQRLASSEPTAPSSQCVCRRAVLVWNHGERPCERVALNRRPGKRQGRTAVHVMSRHATILPLGWLPGGAPSSS